MKRTNFTFLAATALAWLGLLSNISAQTWHSTSGAANDIGAGSNGAVWVVGTNA